MSSPLDRRVGGLRNLREGYGTAAAAVGFWQSLHGEDMIEEYAKLVNVAKAAERVDSAYQEGRDDLDAIYALREALAVLGNEPA